MFFDAHLEILIETFIKTAVSLSKHPASSIKLVPVADVAIYSSQLMETAVMNKH